MPFPPFLANALASLALSDEEKDRLKALHFRDAGHGYDAFGMHPDFVALGSALTRPLYRQYFRVKSEGHERIPDLGPAVLAANHSGSLPIDGMMIWADVVEKTEPARIVRAIADHFVPALPFLGTLFARGGMIGGSRGNVSAALESGELLLIFPEGVPGIIKPWKDRYQLRPFRVGHAELAIRHRAPIVPIGVVGAEEQLPQLTQSRRLGKLFGIPAVPIPATPVPLPVRYYLWYGEPINVQDRYVPEQADDPAVVQAVAEEVQAAVQALVNKGLKHRPGVFV